MAAPVLLVHDDIATIAAVRRLLSREGYEIILATSAADALIAFGHYLPALIILAPEVESGRGDVVLEELAQHPDRGLARVLLLGESIPGFGAPVVPLPLEGRFFLDTLHTVMRAPTIEEWRVLDQRHHTTEAPALVPHQPEPWRATAPPQVQSPGLEGLFSDLPPLEDANWGTAASPEEGTGFLLASEPAAELNRLSVRDEVAAQTRAAIEAELDAFEREVLAEATAIHESSSPEEGDSEIEPPGEEMAFADDADATQVAPAPDTLAAEEAAERDWAEHARRDAEDAVRGEEEEAARRAAPLQALSFADEAPQPEPEDTSSGEAEDAALREAEEAALREAEEAAAAAQREAEEAALREAEEAALGEAEEVARREAEEVARREAEEAALREAEEAALREAEEAALREAEEVALREAEEAALREAEEAAQREAEEAAQREAEEAAQREAEEAALREAEEVAQREAEEAARREAEEAAQREAEEAAAAAQREAEEAAWREAAESAQREAEAAAQREVEEAALREAEAAAQREVEEAALREAEAAAQRELEEAGLHEAEAAAQREVEEAAQREAEEAALREMEAAAQREAEEAALREAQETARREAQEAARREAEERAREQAEIAARQVAEELSRQHARELAAAEERLRHQSEQRDLEQRELEHRFAAEAAQREAQLRVELERAAQVQRDLEQRLEAEAEARARLEEQGSVLRAQLEAEARARQDMESRLAEREAALAAARQREAELLQREQEAAKFAEKLKHAAKKVKQDTEARAGALRRESEAAIAALRQEVEKASDLARLEREERERLEARLAELQGVSDEAQARAESALRIAEEERRQLEAEQRARAEAEAAAVEAKAAAEEIAQRIARPLEIPGAPTVHFPPTATVSIEQLARMVAELARARAEVRIDLRVDDALRTLWLERGALVGAQSSLAHESILDRARRDGLIDGRQEAELRLLRGASPAEFLQQLRARGFLRDQEVVPLVQRHTEAVALEALAEPRSDYRLTVEPPSPDLPVAASPRPTLALVVEALRRGLDLDAHVAPRGGLAALPAPEDAPGDLRPLGLSEREVRLLSLIDGDTSVEELLLASGLKQEAALRLLAAGEVLGWLAIRPAPLEELPPTPELELARLDAKYREVQEVDYFSILGLARSAGGDEVQRAYAQLSTEFDPLKYVGHPDVSIQHRARQIQEALSEAAQVLGDDGLRANYARHLLD